MAYQTSLLVCPSAAIKPFQNYWGVVWEYHNPVSIASKPLHLCPLVWCFIQLMSAVRFENEGARRLSVTWAGTERSVIFVNNSSSSRKSLPLYVSFPVQLPPLHTRSIHFVSCCTPSEYMSGTRPSPAIMLVCGKFHS